MGDRSLRHLRFAPRRKQEYPTTLASWRHTRREVYEAYSDDDWPFAGDPIVDDGFVLLTVAPDAWESQVPSLVERAHRRGLTALDPQWGGEGKLFPPGEPYV
jgi:hypothetical protein